MLINALLLPLRQALVRERPLWLRYSAAAAATVATLWLTALLADATQGHYLPMTLAVIVLSGMFGGLGPGLLAMALTAVVTVTYFYPPYGSFALTQPAHAYRIVLFLAVACFMAVFGAAMRRNVMQMQQAVLDARAQRQREQRRAEQQAAVAELGLLALGAQGPEQVMEAVAATATRTLGAPLSLVLRLDGSSLSSAAGSGWRDQQLPQCSWPLGPATPVGYAAASHRPVVIRDLEQEIRFQLPKPILAAGVRSLAAVAIYASVSAGRVHGTLVVYDRIPRDFSRGDVQFLQLLANIVAVAVERGLARRALESKEEELRLAHEQTADSLARWEAVVGHISDGLVVLDADGRVVAANPAALRMHGLAADELEGRAAQEFAGLFEAYQRDGQRLPPEHWPLSRLLRGEAFDDAEVLIRRRASGNSQIISYSGTTVGDDGGRTRFYVLTSRDLTAARRAEEDQRFLASASATLSESLDHAAVFDRVARLAVPWLADWCAIDAVNAAGELELLAVAHADPGKVALAHEARQRYPSRIDSPHGVGRVVRTGEPEFAPEISEEVLQGVAQDAHHLALLSGLGLRSGIVVPLIARGRTLGALTLIFSESGRRYTEADLATAQDLASRAALAVDNARLFEEAQRATELRDHLMAVVSHDLRNAMGVVRINSGLLLRHGSANERQQRPLEAIDKATTRMDRLINDLMDVTTIQGTGLTVELGRCRAAELLQEALEQQQELAQEHGIRLALGEVADAQVRCDPHRIGQVLSNLLGNAIKFCGAGDDIRLSARLIDGQVRFTVADTGPGISAADQQRIFAPYWSGEGGRTRGTGLGLYISRGIAEAHGGRLWVDSEPGEGSRFHFTLPLADDAPAPA